MKMTVPLSRQWRHRERVSIFSACFCPTLIFIVAVAGSGHSEMSAQAGEEALKTEETATKESSVDTLPAMASIREASANAGETPSPVSSHKGEEDVSSESSNHISSELQEKWGVQVVGARLTAGGYIIDFRYRVLDAEKAAPLFSREIDPYLIDEESGARMSVPNPPKVGPLRNSDTPVNDRVYFILFANPGHYIKRNNKVSIVIGDLKLEHQTVE